MSTSTPIETLIHDLMQERAARFQELVRLAKAQEGRRKKAADAQEKRQVEFARTIGIKQALIDQRLKDDAAQLKARLGEFRPALVTRPGRGAQDAGQLAQFTAVLPLPTRLLPPFGVFFYPPGTTEVQPLSPGQIKMKDVSSGSGLGWPWATAGAVVSPADIVFYFVPEFSGTYSLTVAIAFHGFFVVQADDGTWTSKEASVKMDVSMDTYSHVDRGTKSFTSPIDLDSQNIDEFQNFDKVLTFSDTQVLRAGDPTVVTCSISIAASARGGGSYAEINFSDGDANYIQPQYLLATNLSGGSQTQAAQ